MSMDGKFILVLSIFFYFISFANIVFCFALLCFEYRMPSANTPGGRSSFEGNAMTKTVIGIKEWLYGFTLPTQRKLERKLNTLKDTRLRRQGVPTVPFNDPSSASRPGSGRSSSKRPGSSKRNSIIAVDEKPAAPVNANIFTNDVLLREDVHQMVGHSLNQMLVQILHETLLTANLVTRHGIQAKDNTRKVEILDDDEDIY
jgi:hypothetical protein